jgi:hypothetical protein
MDIITIPNVVLVIFWVVWLIHQLTVCRSGPPTKRQIFFWWLIGSIGAWCVGKGLDVIAKIIVEMLK